MDWKALGAKLIRLGAPVIGGALIGPWGERIGDLIGGLVADQLGVDNTPEAIDQALETMPADALAGKLAAAESEAAAKWDAFARAAEADAADRTAQAQAINVTMQKEFGKVSWWHWRHLIGYVVVGVGLEVLVLLPLVVLRFLTAAEMGAIISQITPFVAIMSGLLGYVAQDTTRQKITAATGAAPPTLTETIKAIVKPKKK